MMKARLPGFHYCRHGKKCVFLFSVQVSENGGHIIRQIATRQQMPAMTARNVLDTSVLFIRIVKAYPAGEMCERHGSRPIRIVLMPCDNRSVPGRLNENLI